MRRPSRSLLVAAALSAMIAFTITLASASSLNVDDPPGIDQRIRDRPVRSDIRDRFTIGATAALQGQVADFNNGTGYVTNAGPIWNTFTGSAPATDWSNNGGNYAIRQTGGVAAAALVRWLTRETNVRTRMNQVVSGTAGGVIMGSNADSTTGLVAVGYWDGSTHRFAIWVITGPGTLALCSTPVDIGATSGTRWDVDMTFAPADAGVATARLVKTGGGGGTFTVSSTCSTATANGTYAGMYDYFADNTRYDNFTGVL